MWCMGSIIFFSVAVNYYFAYNVDTNLNNCNYHFVVFVYSYSFLVPIRKEKYVCGYKFSFFPLEPCCKINLHESFSFQEAWKYLFTTCYLLFTNLLITIAPERWLSFTDLTCFINTWQWQAPWLAPFPNLPSVFSHKTEVRMFETWLTTVVFPTLYRWNTTKLSSFP